MDSEHRLTISQRLRAQPGVRRAWLVRRKVRYLPEHHEHIIFLDLEPRLRLTASRREWPSELLGTRVVVIRGPLRRLVPRLRRIAGADMVITR